KRQGPKKTPGARIQLTAEPPSVLLDLTAGEAVGVIRRVHVGVEAAVGVVAARGNGARRAQLVAVQGQRHHRGSAGARRARVNVGRRRDDAGGGPVAFVANRAAVGRVDELEAGRAE